MAYALFWFNPCSIIMVTGTKLWISLAFPPLINSLSFERRIPIWTSPPCLMMSLCGRLLSEAQIHHRSRPRAHTVDIHQPPCDLHLQWIHLNTDSCAWASITINLESPISASPSPSTRLDLTDRTTLEDGTGAALVHLFSQPCAWWAWTNLICHLGAGCFRRWRITCSFEDISLTKYWHYVPGVARCKPGRMDDK